ncbi:hypothetical protein B296_00022660, partial [Ensete ventricosum]
FEVLEAKIESRLQETVDDFKKSLLEGFSKIQQDGNSTSISKQLDLSEITKRGYQEHDNGYPQMKVEFLRWEDRDSTSWISRVENFFRFHKTPEDSKVEIASIQLNEDAI